MNANSRRTASLPASRRTLAEAIAALREQEAALAATETSLEHGGAVLTEIYSSRDAIEAAEQVLVGAKELAADRFLDPSGTPKGGQTIGEARAALVTAQDRLDVASAARTQLEARLLPLRSSIHWAQEKVAAAALGVLREAWAPQIVELLSDLNRLHRQVIDRGRLLEWLIGSEVITDRGPAAVPGVLEFNNRLTQAPRTWAAVQGCDEARRTWDDALVALKADATAQLPLISIAR